MVKICTWSGCSNTSTTPNNDNVSDSSNLVFFPYPKPCREARLTMRIAAGVGPLNADTNNVHDPYQCDKCQLSLRWLQACNRKTELSVYQKINHISQRTHYVCSQHFVGGWPTVEHPVPELTSSVKNESDLVITNGNHISSESQTTSVNEEDASLCSPVSSNHATSPDDSQSMSHLISTPRYRSKSKQVVYYRCCVKSCGQTSTNCPELGFHRISKAPLKRAFWLSNMQLKNNDVTNSSRICSQHFTFFDYDDYSTNRLNRCAVPTLFPWEVSYNSKQYAELERTHGANVDLVNTVLSSSLPSSVPSSTTTTISTPSPTAASTAPQTIPIPPNARLYALVPLPAAQPTSSTLNDPIVIDDDDDEDISNANQVEQQSSAATVSSNSAVTSIVASNDNLIVRNLYSDQQPKNIEPSSTATVNGSTKRKAIESCRLSGRNKRKFKCSGVQCDMKDQEISDAVEGVGNDRIEFAQLVVLTNTAEHLASVQKEIISKVNSMSNTQISLDDSYDCIVASVTSQNFPLSFLAEKFSNSIQEQLSKFERLYSPITTRLDGPK